MIKSSPNNVYISQPVLGEEEWLALKNPLLSGWVTQGPQVAQFEKAFSSIHGISHSLATTSCTTALHLALAAIGIGPGDEVILPAFTWIATANVIEYVGAKPVFIDIDPGSFNIDVAAIEERITSRTKAIIPVHLFGLCAEMDQIMRIGKQYGLYVIEDAACAIGAAYKGRKAGGLGDIGCFSFHPRKIVTTGEGGMCTTNDAQLSSKMSSLRNHGASVSEEERHVGPKPYLLPEFEVLGFNYRMTDIQAAIGLVQLGKLDAFIAERRYWADWYRDKLQEVSWMILPSISDKFEHSYQSFVCYVDQQKVAVSRNEIMEFLHGKGIHTRPGTHAVHMLKYYADKYDLDPGDYPNARDAYLHSLAIPLHNRMTEEDYRYVVETIKEIG